MSSIKGASFSKGRGTIRPPLLKTGFDCENHSLPAFVFHAYNDPVASQPSGASVSPRRRHVDDHLHTCPRTGSTLGTDPDVRPADVMAEAHPQVKGFVRVPPQKSYCRLDRELSAGVSLAGVDLVIVTSNLMSRAHLVTVSFLLVATWYGIQHLRRWD